MIVGKDHHLRARLLVQRVTELVAAHRVVRVEDAHAKRRPSSRDVVDLAEWAMVIQCAERHSDPDRGHDTVEHPLAIALLSNCGSAMDGWMNGGPRTRRECCVKSTRRSLG